RGASSTPPGSARRSRTASPARPAVDYPGRMSQNSPAPVPAAAPGADADRERLRELIRDLAVVRGRVTMSSGAEADHYVDLRRLTLQHEAAPLVGRVMLELMRQKGRMPEVEADGGLTLGADPVATAMLHASAADAASGTASAASRPLDALLALRTT